jgi:late competence protein required for DNA uptake (superfamily II DNA/RNA helicase)
MFLRFSKRSQKRSQRIPIKIAKKFNNTSKQIPKFQMINPKSCSMDVNANKYSILLYVYIHYELTKVLVLLLLMPPLALSNVGWKLLEENTGMSKMDDKWA